MLIGAKDGLLAFDIAPRFWNALDTHIYNGRIRFPARVYQEITNEYHDDELAAWAREREDTHFIDPTPDVEEALRQVVAYVVSTYEQAFADVFVGGADPWLIAHAMAQGGRVVSHEGSSQLPNPNRESGRSRARVKIPHVCTRFNVQCVMLHDMLRGLSINDL